MSDEKQAAGALGSNAGLGPLPEADVMWEDGKDQWGYAEYSHAYSAEAMQAYAAAQVAAERRRWLETVQHAATELAELDDETAQFQAAALVRLCGPNVLLNGRQDEWPGVRCCCRRSV